MPNYPWNKTVYALPGNTSVSISTSTAGSPAGGGTFTWIWSISELKKINSKFTGLGISGSIASGSGSISVARRRAGTSTSYSIGSFTMTTYNAAYKTGVNFWGVIPSDTTKTEYYICLPNYSTTDEIVFTVNATKFSPAYYMSVMLTAYGRLAPNPYGTSILLCPTDPWIPSKTPTQTPTRTPTNTRTRTPTPTRTRTSTPTPTQTPTVTRTRTPTPTLTPTITKTSSLTRTSTPTPTSSSTPNETKTSTPTPTPTFTPTVSVTSTITPSLTQTPTNTLSPTPTNTLTPTPTLTITPSPTRFSVLGCGMVFDSRTLGTDVAAKQRTHVIHVDSSRWGKEILIAVDAESSADRFKITYAGREIFNDVFANLQDINFQLDDPGRSTTFEIEVELGNPTSEYKYTIFCV